MPRPTTLPPALAIRAVWLRLRGRVHFPRTRIGEIVGGEAEDFRVFRQMVVDPVRGHPAHPGAVLEVQFRFARFSPAVNKRLSRLPMPFIAAQPGFRSKTWMVGLDSGAFRGVYEWDTCGDAEQYWDSFPMRMMKRRAEAGTLTRQVRTRTATPEDDR